MAWIYASINSNFCTRVSWASLRWESAEVNHLFNGPNIARSGGWTRCHVWGGRIRSMIRFWRQWAITLPLIWESWPSQRGRRYWLPAFVRVLGLKTLSVTPIREDYLSSLCIGRKEPFIKDIAWDPILKNVLPFECTQLAKPILENATSLHWPVL